MIIIDTVKLPKPRRLFKEPALIDGVRAQADMGTWAVYIPSLQLKILHSFQGNCHSISPRSPDRIGVLKGDISLNSDRYTIQDWKNIYQKETTLRTAENYVCAMRLYEAGIGPKVIDFVFVRNFHGFYDNEPSWTSGLIIENLKKYPKKLPTTYDDLRKARVIPDHIRSCIRQQIHGYVSDLNSVIGVMPIEGDAEVEAIYGELQSVQRN